AFLQCLGFAYPSPFPPPTLQGLILKISEDPRRSACRFELLFRFRHLRLKELLQSFVLGLAEEVINLVALAPGHDLVTRKTRIASQPDPHPRPFCAQSLHNPLDLIQRAAPQVVCPLSASARRAENRRRRDTAADRNNRHNSRERSVLLVCRATDRRSRPGR